MTSYKEGGRHIPVDGDHDGESLPPLTADDPEPDPDEADENDPSFDPVGTGGLPSGGLLSLLPVLPDWIGETVGLVKRVVTVISEADGVADNDNDRVDEGSIMSNDGE
jgi:hypothetical protein